MVAEETEKFDGEQTNCRIAEEQQPLFLNLIVSSETE